MDGHDVQAVVRREAGGDHVLAQPRVVAHSDSAPANVTNPTVANVTEPERDYSAFAREHSPNNSPRLAIREGESVFVWFLRFPDRAAYERFLASLEHSVRWTEPRSRRRSQIT